MYRDVEAVAAVVTAAEWVADGSVPVNEVLVMDPTPERRRMEPEV